MPAGTIAVTNGSSTVTGTGTSFTTELKAGDFIGIIAGGTPYTLIVAAIASDTQLTIGAAFAGPTVSGLAWNAIPASLLYAVTQQIMNDMGTALRGMNSQLVNWQKIYSDASSVTVERPDRTTFTGPSWGYMATQFGNKLDKTQSLSDLEDKAAARTNLGLGDAATRSVGSASGTVAAGNDSRIAGALQTSGGTMTGRLNSTAVGYLSAKLASGWTGNGSAGSNGMTYTEGYTSSYYATQDFSYDGTNGYSRREIMVGPAGTKVWEMRQDGTFRSPGAVFANGVQLTSDSNLKFNKKFIADPLLKVAALRGMSYEIDGVRKVGVIAQDAQQSLDGSVVEVNEPVVLSDGTILEKTLSLDYSAITAANTEAIKALLPLMLQLLDDPVSAKKELSRLIKAINKSNDDANKTDEAIQYEKVDQPVAMRPEANVEELSSDDGSA